MQVNSSLKSWVNHGYEHVKFEKAMPIILCDGVSEILNGKIETINN
jgi:hypothetical protein